MTERPPEKLYLTTKIAYGAGDLGPAIAANISVFYLLFFLTDVAGLSPGWAGSVLTIGKIADAINDPLIGMWNDRSSTRWGRRLPWILFGAIPFGAIYLLQWSIPTENRGLLFVYYVLVGIFFNLFYTIVNLPYQALTPELTLDYHERTGLNSFRFAFSIGGSILSLVLYIVIANAYPHRPREQFLLLALLCSSLSVIALVWCALGLRERGAKPLLDSRRQKRAGTGAVLVGTLSSLYGSARFFFGGLDFATLSTVLLGMETIAFGLTLRLAKPEPHLCDERATRQRREALETPAIAIGEQLSIVFTNRPFLYVIGIYLCSWLGVQLTASIIVYFVVNIMRLPEKQSGSVALAVQATALVMLFVWQKIARKLDKKTVYFLGTSCWLVAQIGLFLLRPGQTGWMYVLAILAGFGVSVAYLIPWSMIPDVIELDELRTGRRREGVFYAFMVFLQKIGLALGLFLVGVALEGAGFKPAVAGQTMLSQPESALLAIRFAIGPLPAFFLLVSLILAYFYPLTRAVHEDILARLEERRREREEER